MCTASHVARDTVLLINFLTDVLTYWPQYCEGDFILHFAGMRPHWGCSDSRTLVMQYCSGAAKDESAVLASPYSPHLSTA